MMRNMLRMLRRSMPVTALLILVALLSGGSGIYAGASFFAPQATVTVTTTIFTTVTNWITSTVMSTITETTQGVLTIIQYTSSTSTVTVTTQGTGTFGTMSVGTGIGGAASYIVATKYALSQPGTVTQVSIYSPGSGQVKVGIYADNAGAPGALIVANNSPTAVAAGQWTTISLTPTGLAAGNYWIAFNENVGNLRSYKAGGTAQAAYASYPFTSNMPTNWTPAGYQNFDYVCYATYNY